MELDDIDFDDDFDDLTTVCTKPFHAHLMNYKVNDPFLMFHGLLLFHLGPPARRAHESFGVT